MVSDSSPGRQAGWLGVPALLAVAGGASLLLSLAHLNAIGLPGCGVGSACARAAASRWGTLPGLGWPVAYAGAAFFWGVTAMWGMARGGLGAAGRVILRLGVAASVFFLVVSAGERLWCPYCVAAHAANLAAWGLAERRWRGEARAGSGARGVLAFVLVAAAVSAGLGLAEGRTRGAAAERAARKLEDSTRAIRAGVSGTRFTGRYRLGPEGARARIVMFTDYQCPDCRAVDEQVSALVKERGDVSVSVKHFPFCLACNPRAGRDLHPNACWAARAAEAAGALGGSAGFWKMHDWLFARLGAFTDAQLREALPSMGFDADRFVAEMTSERTLAPVRADIEEAAGVGIESTPMIFVNGVEVRGWNAPGGVRRAVDAAGAGDPDDRPPEALARLVADWESRAAEAIAPSATAHVTGAAGGRVSVVLFGDYQEPNCARADALLRAIAGKRTDTSYEYRHFPLDQSCNPGAKVNLHPVACRMARAAEAAGELGGESAFWTVHAWIFEHQRTYTDGSVRGVLEGLGVAPEAFDAARVAGVGAEKVEEDCREAMARGIAAVPLIFVNGKRVARWEYEDLPVMERIVERAGG